MQMVSISRALLGAPGLVLFDEPSQGLAVADRAYVMNLGRIVHEGPAAKLREDAPLRRKFLGV